MTIHYTMVMNDRTRIPTSYVCFGRLNCLDAFGGYAIEGSNRLFPRHLTKTQAFERFDIAKIKAIEFNFLDSICPPTASPRANRQRICGTFVEEFQRYVDNFPTFKSIASVNTKLNIVRVEAENQPMDKVMFVLSVLRNMFKKVVHADRDRTTDAASVNATTLLEERIPDWKIRTLFSWCFSITANRTLFDTEPQLQIDGITSGEYSILHTNTIGKTAILRLYNDDNTIPWVLSSFAESEGGYLRDHHFHGKRMCFPGVSASSLRNQHYNSDGLSFFPNGRLPENTWIGKLLYRKLFDAICVQNDECLITGGTWHPQMGFTIPYHNPDDRTFDTESVINEFLSIFPQ